MHTTVEGSADGWLRSRGEGERIWIAGDALTIKASAQESAGSLTLVEIEAAPAEGPPPHIHTREDEALYVLEGQFEIVVGERRVFCGPGTFAFVPRGTVHRFSCTGQGPGRVLALFTPGGMDGFFREAGRPATGDGPPPPVDADEIARTQAAGERHGLQVVTWEARAPGAPQA
jgi:quercetin dioxygenase-like cupin family protein